MSDAQLRSLNRLRQIQSELSDGWMEYWKTYSNIDTWQFWLNVVLLIAPLVVLYFKIDRKRAFFIGFYGYSVHIVATYVDGFATRFGLWEYPYQAIPFLPISFALDTSLIPVVYMLMYQWILKKDKNYYLYSLLVSALFAFVLKPFFAALDLIHLEKGMNYFYLFLFYFVGTTIAKWITNVFIYLKNTADQNHK